MPGKGFFRTRNVWSGWRKSAGISAFCFLLSGCAAPSMEASTAEGRAAILNATYKALTAGQCEKAIGIIDPAFASSGTNNEIRMARASAHACNAGIPSFFTFIENAAAENWGVDAPPGGSFLFRSVAKLFAETNTSVLAKRISSSRSALQALQSHLKTGVYVAQNHQITTSAYNPGSTLASDRSVDSNLYLLFVSMASLGAIENRYGAPDATTFKKGQALGTQGTTDWESYLRIDEDACLYASSLLSLIDAYIETADTLSSGLASSLGDLSVFTSVFDLACAAGCNNQIPPVSVGGTTSGCATNAGLCDACPRQLRDPSVCTSTANLALGNRNPYACAAAGLINFVNRNPILGWGS